MALSKLERAALKHFADELERHNDSQNLAKSEAVIDGLRGSYVTCDKRRFGVAERWEAVLRNAAPDVRALGDTCDGALERLWSEMAAAGFFDADVAAMKETISR